MSDADREQIYEALKAHAAAGRLSMEELELRVAAVAAAPNRDLAAQALADLPPLPAADAPGPGGPGAAARPRRRRGHAEADRPDPSWEPTEERFRDPRSGRVMRVWVDTAGGRHYVAEQA